MSNAKQLTRGQRATTVFIQQILKIFFSAAVRQVTNEQQSHLTSQHTQYSCYLRNFTDNKLPKSDLGSLLNAD